ncbi:MAG TPA: beta-ketoacyl-ACP synthase II [Thermoleophilaceae bacterium]|nr:beta-ketoacyl-ACP synthase II [Thermoleophilaceae bacterium]
MKRRVAITGLGAVSPLGVGAGELIGRWAEGASGIADGEGRCADFDPADHLSRKELRRADRFTQMALTASGEALAQAGFNGERPVSAERTACVIGTGIGGIGTIEEQHLVLEHKGAAQVSPLAIPLLMANAASGSVAMKNDLRGQCYGVVSACAAGAHAIGAGVRMVQYGDADACLVGGSEAAITPLASAAFGSMAAISPTGESRPFDARRDGFVMGEGAGALMLEDEEAARERGAEILGVIVGYGATADAHHLTAPEPSGDGAARAIAAALEDAGIAPGGIDYVNAHGTSTPLNDRAETEALQTALGAHAGKIPVSSLKSSIGHLLGAAGAVEAVATALALQRGVAPPTVGWEQRDEGMDLDYVPDSARPLEGDGSRPLRAISNSFGFGGHNAVLCIEASS